MFLKYRGNKNNRIFYDIQEDKADFRITSLHKQTRFFCIFNKQSDLKIVSFFVSK